MKKRSYRISLNRRLLKKSKIDEKVISKYTVTFFRIKNFFRIINDFTLTITIILS